MNGARPDVAAACVEGMGQTFDVPLLAQRGINIDHQVEALEALGFRLEALGVWGVGRRA